MKTDALASEATLWYTEHRKLLSLAMLATSQAMTNERFFIRMNSISSLAQKGNSSLSERFWSKVDTSGECWLWTAALDRKGYGRFRMPTHHEGAHRMAYMLTYGDIPDDLVVCHRCDNPTCVRPDHLFVGTLKDNTQDSVQKGRNSPPPCTSGDAHWTRRHPTKILRGEQCPTAKLSSEQVKAIRVSYATGEYTMAQLGKQYGVGKTHIHRIVHNLIWKEGD